MLKELMDFKEGVLQEPIDIELPINLPPKKKRDFVVEFWLFNFSPQG